MCSDEHVRLDIASSLEVLNFANLTRISPTFWCQDVEPIISKNIYNYGKGSPMPITAYRYSLVSNKRHVSFIWDTFFNHYFLTQFEVKTYTSQAISIEIKNSNHITNPVSVSTSNWMRKMWLKQGKKFLKQLASEVTIASFQSKFAAKVGRQKSVSKSRLANVT